MNESAIYNEGDLAPFHRRLNELQKITRHDAETGKHSEAMTKLLERQLNDCGAFVLRPRTSYAPVLLLLQAGFVC
jgi:hypothetical protein